MLFLIDVTQCHIATQLLDLMIKGLMLAKLNFLNHQIQCLIYSPKSQFEVSEAAPILQK